MRFFNRTKPVKTVVNEIDKVTMEMSDPYLRNKYSVTYVVRISATNSVIIDITHVECNNTADITDIIFNKKVRKELITHFYNVIYNSILHCKGCRA